MNDFFVRRRDVERRKEQPDVIETELDPETLRAEKPAQRFLVSIRRPDGLFSFQWLVEK